MKKITLLISASLIYLTLFSQKITINASINPDAFDIADQVIIGFDENATIQINTQLGEEDLSNTPITGDFDLRVVQRNQDTYDCMVDTAGNNLIYQNHIESKIDLRSPNNQNPENAYFEIMPNGVFNGFTLELEKYHTPEARKGYLNLATKAECEDENFQFYLALPDPDVNPIFLARILLTPLDVNQPLETPVSEIPLFKKLYVHMEQDILSSTSTIENNDINGIAFPNPTSSNVSLDWCGSAELVSINGKSIQLDNSSNCKKNLILDHLPAGAYFVKLFNDQSLFLTTIKIIKI